MVCRLFIKPSTDCKALFLDRQKQGYLQLYLQKQLHYTPFVFNSLVGVFIFTKKKEDSSLLSIWVTTFLKDLSIENYSLVDCSEDPEFFKRFTRAVLGNKKASALAWKRFLNSFIHQVNPFSPGGSQGIKTFKRFLKVVRKEGDTIQKKYLKQRLNMLRNRVSIASLEAIIKRKT